MMNNDINTRMPTFYPVACHTDHVGPGSIFVAISGTREDGARYIPQAIQNGAREIVVATDAILEPETTQLIEKAGIKLSYTDNTRAYLAQQSAQACGNPAQKIKIIGITGTKGKTTTSFLVEHILKYAGYKTALLTTVSNHILDNSLEAPLTTPQPDYLHVFLRQCVAASVEYVIMEVSAQALSFNRLDGIMFDGLIFTNFEQDHLDYYQTMENYFNAKVKFMSYRKQSAFACINADDPWVSTLIGSYACLCTFGITNKDTNVYARLKGDQKESVHFDLYSENMTMEYIVPSLIGRFNAYNCLAASCLSLRLGIDIDTIARALKSFDKVPGRLEVYQLPNGARAIVDYAHNPSSCAAVLALLSDMTDHLIVVLGAGGERDRTKRPLMGSIAVRYGNIFIVTSDNPRSEDPYLIAREIMEGVTQDKMCKVIQELDRIKAIEKAYTLSKPHSIIAVLGRGHEEYQIIGTIKHRLSDAQIVQALR